MQLWAGAFVIDPKKEYAERMRSAFHLSIVNGRVTNFYSKGDNVLTYMQPSFHSEPGTISIGI